MATGTAIVDFGAFPGSSHASVAITGQANIVAGSLVEAWLRPAASADHTADEHMVETIKVCAADIVPGTGFTIHAFNTSQLNEPLINRHRETPRPVVSAPRPNLAPWVGGMGTRIYGQWNVQWAGNYS